MTAVVNTETLEFTTGWMRPDMTAVVHFKEREREREREIVVGLY